MKKLIINSEPIKLKRIEISNDRIKRPNSLKTKLTCQMCLFWSKKKHLGSSLICVENGKSIFADSEACIKNFKLADWFWCHKNNMFLTVDVCINRQRCTERLMKNGVWASCKKCRDGKNLMSYLNQNK